MGLGSALSEKEGAVSPPSFLFYCRSTNKGHGFEEKTFIALDALGEALGSMQPTLILALYQEIRMLVR